MVFEFTSSTGRKNHGLVIEHVGSGVNVLLDSFTPNGKSTLPVRFRYVNLDGNPFCNNGSTRRLLDGDALVDWASPELRQLQIRMANDDWQASDEQEFLGDFV